MREGKQVRALWAFIVFGCLTCSDVFASGKLSDALMRVLRRGDPVIPVILILEDKGILPSYAWGEISSFQRIKMLQAYRMQSQRSIREAIRDVYNDYHYYADQTRKLDRVKFFWAINAVQLTASRSVLRELSERSDVRRVLYDRRISIPDRDRMFEQEVSPDDAIFQDEYTYGLAKIGIPELRQTRSGVDGSGVVVGIIDTGIDATHPELQGKLMLFKDFADNKLEPSDQHGHGTHVAGTIAGSKPGSVAIGIAPKAKLVIGKAFDSSGYSSTSILLGAMEWMLDPDGDPKTNDQPAVVNNSWGGSMDEDAATEPFWDLVTKWVDFNIFPSFAAGNEGPGDGTVGHPGGYPHSFGVGATDDRDDIADFSSRGPVRIKIKGELKVFTKPDVSAPGVDILSSLPGNRYAKWSGTSMATPHVTGVVALLKQIKPQSTVADLIRSLEAGAVDLGENGKDNTFGSGRIDAVRSADLVSNR